MKTPIRVIAILSVLSMFLYGCVTVETQWETAKRLDTIEAYESFLEKCSDSQFSLEAHQRIEQHRWNKARSQDTVDAYQDYLSHYPKSQHSSEAKSRQVALQIEFDWQKAQRSDNIEGYELFISNHTNNQYSEHAKSRLQQLHEQFSIWQSVVQHNSLDSYRDFVKRYPNSQYAIKAKTLITEWEKDTSGWSIVDALDSKRVEVEVGGDGIKSVLMKIRRRVDRPVRVTVPVGSYFVCGGSSQNMISRQERSLVLNNDTWRTVSIPAACANRARPIPGTNDHFTVRASPRQAELKQLMTVIEEERIPFAVEQAAIWIVTDNADYTDLGVLVSRPVFQGSGGTRVINHDEAAKAMKICYEAGIEIRKKAIWRNRSTILQGIKNEILKVTFRDWMRKIEGN